LLEEELSRKLEGLSRERGVTLFMSVLAGLTVLLSKYAGQEDVAVGTPVANRRRVEVEGMIGFFVNTLVLRMDVGGNPSWEEVLQRVRQVALQGYQHQDVPFERVVEELQPGRDLSRSALFGVMLVMQNTEQQELEMEGVRLSRYEIETGVAKFDVVVTLQEEEEGWCGEISYASDVYEAGTMERLGGHLRGVLEQMVEGVEERIGEVSLLRGRELVVHQHEVGIDRGHRARDLLQFAFADQGCGIGTVAMLNEFAGNRRPGGCHQLAELRQRFFNTWARGRASFELISSAAREHGTGWHFQIAVCARTLAELQSDQKRPLRAVTTCSVPPFALRCCA